MTGTGEERFESPGGSANQVAGASDHGRLEVLEVVTPDPSHEVVLKGGASADLRDMKTKTPLHEGQAQLIPRAVSRQVIPPRQFEATGHIAVSANQERCLPESESPRKPGSSVGSNLTPDIVSVIKLDLDDRLRLLIDALAFPMPVRGEVVVLGGKKKADYLRRIHHDLMSPVVPDVEVIPRHEHGL